MIDNTSGTKFISLDDLRDEGYLMEANRLFFHPLGLALYLEYDENDEPVELMVMDARDDPEGIVFESLAEEMDKYKNQNVSIEMFEKAEIRKARFGWVFQPIGTQFQ